MKTCFYGQGKDMKNRDLVSSAVWIVFGILFVAGSLHEGLMRRGVPGPGFLPFLSGLALIFVSLFVLIPALYQNEKTASNIFFPRKLLFALISLFAFGFAMQYVGYLLTTFLFMFFIGRLMEPKGWRTITLLALLTAVLSHILFVVLLEVQLPKGLLEF